MDPFLDSLIKYDKENIHPNITTAIDPYLKDKEFDPDFIRTKSGAAAGLCSWVINVVRFYEVPFQIKLAKHRSESAHSY